MKRIGTIVVLAGVAGCASAGMMEENNSNVRMMEASGIAWGDCAEANRQAAARPDLEVDSLPRAVSQRPAPFSGMPPAVRNEINSKGSSVKVNVVVDTLGRPVMKTFTVVESSHPWLAQNLKRSMPSWRFRAARLAGCKVARVYKFSATSRPRRS